MPTCKWADKGQLTHRFLPRHVDLDLGEEEIVGTVQKAWVEVGPNFGQGVGDLLAGMTEPPHFVDVVLGGKFLFALVHPRKDEEVT